MEKVEEEGGDLCSLNNCIKCKVHQSNAIFGRNVSYEGGARQAKGSNFKTMHGSVNKCTVTDTFIRCIIRGPFILIQDILQGDPSNYIQMKTIIKVTINISDFYSLSSKKELSNTSFIIMSSFIV